MFKNFIDQQIKFQSKINRINLDKMINFDRRKKISKSNILFVIKKIIMSIFHNQRNLFVVTIETMISKPYIRYYNPRKDKEKELFIPNRYLLIKDEITSMMTIIKFKKQPVQNKISQILQRPKNVQKIQSKKSFILYQSSEFFKSIMNQIKDFNKNYQNNM